MIINDKSECLDLIILLAILAILPAKSTEENTAAT